MNSLTSYKRVAIFAAMGFELKPLVDHLTEVHEGEAGRSHLLGQGFNRDIHLVKTGVGIENARRSVAMFLEKFHIDLGIMVGVAGGLHDGLSPLDTFYGDVVLAPTRDRFTLREDFKEDIKSLGGGREGTLLTLDEYVIKRKRRNGLRANFQADTVDMESAAVVKGLVGYGLPWLVIRTLSDLADEKAGADGQDFGRLAAEKSAALCVKLLEG